MAETTLYIGLMSGTSLDGIDAALARFDPQGRPTLLARAAVDFPPPLREELLRLNSSGPDELERAAQAANALAALYADAVKRVLSQASVSSKDVAAIGAHGQTVRHRPDLGFTIQLNAPALLAELTGISVIADFRSRDVAAGGQGAPLVPIFHAGVFPSPRTRVILNLGGIANITILRPQQAPQGFDTGPANVLMDMWCARHTGQSYDPGGAWGAAGQPDARLLQHLIDSEPWFSQPAPKSTGRDLFNWTWLEKRLETFNQQAVASAVTSVVTNAVADAPTHDSTSPPTARISTQMSAQVPAQLSAQNIQATLTYLTAKTVAQCVQTYANDAHDVLVCGGGARNQALMDALQEYLPCSVRTTQAEGVGTQDVEALAFAWLAWAHQRGIPAGNPAVTGAAGQRILGACWPA